MLDELMIQLQSAGDQVPMSNILGSLLASIMMAFVLSKIYHLYFGPNEPSEHSIGSSFMLLMPAVTSIFVILQYSLPLSLGLLGAMSFVRFRTPVKRAEDIAFILLAIAISLSCAVLYFYGALALLVLVGLYAMLKSRLPEFQLFAAGATLVTLHDEEE